MMNNNEPYIPEVVSVQGMAKLLQISRSRLYSLMDEGVFLKPVYSLNKKRPHFSREMALKNISAKKNNTGINGSVVVFYSSNLSSAQKIHKSPKPKTKVKKTPPQNKYSELKEGLESLGLSDITDSKIGTSLAQCFPNGTDNIGEDEVLTTVFRHIKCQNSSDNVGR